MRYDMEAGTMSNTSPPLRDAGAKARRPSTPLADGPSVAVETAASVEAFRSLEPAWNTLVRESASPNVFLTWEWVSTWWDVFGRDGEPRVLVAREPRGGAIVGIVPFVLTRRPAVGPTLWRELVFMGCTGTAPDHLDCIARQGWEEPVARAFARRLAAKTGSWDVLRLDGMRSDSMLARLLGERDDRRPGLVWEIPCPYVPLPETWEEYQRALDGKFRRNLRRRRRNLEDEAGEPVSFRTVSVGEDLSAGMSALFRLHQAGRGDGEKGAFDTAHKRAFFIALARRFHRKGWLRLHLLEIGDRAIAAALCFQFGGKVWFYQTGYDRDWARYSPGSTVIHAAMRSAIEGGAHEFDMLRGGEDYKYRWNTEPRSIMKMRLASTAAVGGTVVVASRILRGVRERWKEWR